MLGTPPQAEELEAAVAPPEESWDRAGPPEIRLCDEHKNALVPMTCSTCRNVASRLREGLQPGLVDEVKEDPSAVPGTRARLRWRRSDSLLATLGFTEDKVVLHQEIHRPGSFRKGYFDEVTKKWFRLSRPQHKACTQNLETEELFKR